ncbi:hypothetical protein GUITHDRAFT_148516 [Guillardia theta CCMP2712]|uniref:Uncharacterized protein n=2 Tax=Guillardia theta TaxID=55529 RepID=L1I9R7_GUITC|nr:hypothetical protein GUITHDRAFT_148516 [Guillardia theta CCMP2712]EKX32600.1 hypothetical protein GUITHDRAFT_148516 [Guillardia theta CCMP2712]|eukprot:XP_005819580.1 hypothetical protein GUITHDRAFT_148516 [Guillardia theta CCMP2712]
MPLLPLTAVSRSTWLLHLLLAVLSLPPPPSLGLTRHPEHVPVAINLQHVQGAVVEARIVGMQPDVSYSVLMQAIVDGLIVFSQPMKVKSSRIEVTISELPLGVNQPTISCKLYDDYPHLSTTESLLASVQKQLPITIKEPPYSDETRLRIACSEQSFEVPPSLQCCSSSHEQDLNISLASIGSIDRSIQMLHVMLQWDGPVSLVFYARSEEEERFISAFVEETMIPAAVRSCRELNLQLLSDCHDQGSPERVYPFPVNKLRSVAVSRAKTDLVLYIDVDFIPSADAARQLQQAMSSPSFDQAAGLLVLPAFLTVWSSPWPSPMRVEDEGMQVEPLHLDELKRRCIAGDVYPPEMPFRMSPHGATDYLKWFHMPANRTEPFQVLYSMWYEPYFVVNRRLWRGINHPGLFDERFVDAGPDKVQLAYEAAVLGYSFFVHPTAFLVHVPERKELFCHDRFAQLCKKQEVDKTNWKDKTLYFSNFQFLDFIFSMPRWTDHRVPEGFHRPCFTIPFAYITELSRRELISFLFPPAKVKMVWTCARDKCERVHEKFMLWQGHFLPPSAFQVPPPDLEARQSFREAFSRWCFTIPPLVGIYFVRSGRVFIQYDSLLLNGEPDEVVNASHKLYTSSAAFVLEMFEDSGTSTAEVPWENECFEQTGSLAKLVLCHIQSKMETRQGNFDVILRSTYLMSAS